jgi:hypothetical protein
MSNQMPDPQTEPRPKAPTPADRPRSDDEPEPDLTTPGGRFWELPLDEEEMEALSFNGF